MLVKNEVYKTTIPPKGKLEEKTLGIKSFNI